MFNFLKPAILVATHNGSFHADDVFACATLSIWAEKNGHRIKVIRTRDKNEIDKADIVVDVGIEYEVEKKRFDHHQVGGAGERANGIPYASFGLVWKHYGEKICEKEIVEIIDKRLVTPVDARDNGINIYTPKFPGVYEYRAGDIIHTIRKSTNNEKVALAREFDWSLSFAKKLIEAEIILASKEVEGRRVTMETIESQNEPEILVLGKYVEWEEAVSKFKKIKFVVYPDVGETEWKAEVARESIEDFNSDRAEFPKSWAGLRGKNLIEVSGVEDAIFCIKGCWVVSAKSKAGAIEMAQKALNML